MKKAVLADLITSTKTEKYKLYKLTDNGRHLSKQLKISSSKILTRKESLNYLVYYLKSSPVENSFSKE